jgi:GT2 family glycosyltransferase
MSYPDESVTVPDRRPCAVTVVIITRDRSSELNETLQRLMALPERPPIIVVDNASSDVTPAVIARAGPEVRGVRLERNAGAAGRNTGVEHAQTPYVAFSDDDSCWAPGALADAARLFDGYPRLGLLAARMLVGSSGRLDPICREMENSPLPRAIDLPGPSVLGFLACGAVVRRRGFLEAGGFHDRLGVGGEEGLLAIDLARRGWGLAYCHDVVAHHYPASAGVRPGRQARLVRNALWTAWLRYRLPEALAATGRAMRQSLTNPDARAGLAAAAHGLPWILRERSPIDGMLQRHLSALARISGIELRRLGHRTRQPESQ